MKDGTSVSLGGNTVGGSGENHSNGMFSYYFSIKLSNFIEKTPPNGVVDSMIFEIENHRIPSHYDLHIKNFNSDELKLLIEYQYQCRLHWNM